MAPELTSSSVASVSIQKRGHSSPTSRKLPSIHWLMIFGVLSIVFGSITSIRSITHEIDKNTAQNKIVLEQSKYTALDADHVADHVIPIFTFLHSLEIAVIRHIAEFELYVLDFDRDQSFLIDSLALLETALTKFPENSHYLSEFDRKELKEIVDVFVDITHEAQEVRFGECLLGDSNGLWVRKLCPSETRSWLRGCSPLTARGPGGTAVL